MSVTKVEDVRVLVRKGIENPKRALPAIRRLAESADWKRREVAAAALVEIGKKRKDEIVKEMIRWVESEDPNVRRAAVEGLRDIARKDPRATLAILERAKGDTDLYVKKSVANVLRNASRYDPAFVLDLCHGWARLRNADTNWIIRDGLRKLRQTHPKDVESVLEALES